MGPTLDCEAAIHKMSLQLAQNLYALWTESPHSSAMDATCSFARLTPDDPMEPTEIDLRVAREDGDPSSFPGIERLG